jgi:hypothetical protein
MENTYFMKIKKSTGIAKFSNVWQLEKQRVEVTLVLTIKR